ncbi:MAG: DUF4236 domain-containing protein [Balneolales bacterium]|nr:DUF4236 domain-containing protein [Balneolales bacterium]
MAFFLRKAFKTGPVRFNLSKGGVGISAGITGARLGLNSRGMPYVHGGRHGVYYRKNLNSGRRKGRSAGSDSGDNRAWQQQAGVSSAEGIAGERLHPVTSAGGSTDLFKDTGVTYPSAAQDLPDRILPPPPPGGSSQIRRPLILSLLVAAWLLFFNFWLFLASLTVPLVIAFRGRHQHQQRMNKAYAFTDQMEAWLDAGSQRSAETILKALQAFNASVPEDYKPRFHHRWYIVFVEKAIDECLYAEAKPRYWKSMLEQIEAHMVLDADVARSVRQSLFRQELETALEDHLLSEQEEVGLLLLIDELGLDEPSQDPAASIQPERGLMEAAIQIRHQMDQPLDELDNPGVPLVRGEIAYRVIEPVRLLNERVLNRFQQDKVVYRELGYETELEGKVIITNRRMLFIETTGDTRTREYRLNKVVDVIADPARNLLEIILSDRKSPVTVTSPSVLVMAALVERVRDAG